MCESEKLQTYKLIERGLQIDNYRSENTGGGGGGVSDGKRSGMLVVSKYYKCRKKFSLVVNLGVCYRLVWEGDKGTQVTHLVSHIFGGSTE